MSIAHWYPLGGKTTTGCGLKAGAPGTTNVENSNCPSCPVEFLHDLVDTQARSKAKFAMVPLDVLRAVLGQLP